MVIATETRERPVLFAGEMVRAILSGQKTQTRRIVKPQPDNTSQWDWQWMRTEESDRPEWLLWSSMVGDGGCWDCPYGDPGDRLWVRETWHAQRCFDEKSPSAIEDAATLAGYAPTAEYPACGLWYAADGSHRRWCPGKETKGKKRVSIHMPRWASRITLRINRVRVERLQDITYTDALAEGTPDGKYERGDPWIAETSAGDVKLHEFEKLWESINGKGSWGENPWVWVIKFKKL